MCSCGARGMRSTTSACCASAARRGRTCAGGRTKACHRHAGPDGSAAHAQPALVARLRVGPGDRWPPLSANAPFACRQPDQLRASPRCPTRANGQDSNPGDPLTPEKSCGQRHARPEADHALTIEPAHKMGAGQSRQLQSGWTTEAQCVACSRVSGPEDARRRC